MMDDQDSVFFAFAERVERTSNTIRARFDLLPEKQLTWLSKLHPADRNMGFAEITPGILTVDVAGQQRDDLLSRITGTLRESVWYRLLSGKDGIPSRLHAELQAREYKPANISTLDRIDGRSKDGRLLNAAFSISDFPQGGEREVRAALRDSSECAADSLRVGVYNVGQGNANALCDNTNRPLVYFDLGGGCAWNAHTYQNRKQLCWTRHPPVVLSHWDFDHYFSGTFLKSSWQSTWIVPSQGVIGPTARKMLANIVIGGGSIIVWSHPPWVLNVGPITLARPAPTSTAKNRSGIVLRVDIGTPDGGKWPVLLAGDMGYGCLSDDIKLGIVGLVAAHHGGHRYAGKPPAASDPAIVVYSYGMDNSYRHPTDIAIRRHQACGWKRQLDTPEGDIVLAPNPALQPPPCTGQRCGIFPTQQ